MNDLQTLKKCFDDLEIEYHELVENGYTYIQKLKPHEEPGKLRGHYMAIPTHPLMRAEQLDNFFEFDKDGDLASW